MDTAVKAVNAALDELGLRYSSELAEPELYHYGIKFDESEDLEIDAVLYLADGEPFLRLMAYADDLSETQSDSQMRLLLALNGELPAGAFCMDPESGTIYATCNLAVTDLAGEALSEAIELLLYCIEVYDGSFYPAESDGVSLN